MWQVQKAGVCLLEIGNPAQKIKHLGLAAMWETELAKIPHIFA